MFKSNRLIVIFVQFFIINSGLSLDFSVSNLTYYRLRINIDGHLESRELIRGMINKNNSWLSAELVNSPENKREIYFFKLMGDPDDKILLKKKQRRKIENPTYDARQLLWSRSHPSRFSFIHRNKKFEYEFFKVQFKQTPTDLKPMLRLGTSRIVKNIDDFYLATVLNEDRLVAVISDDTKVTSIPVLGKDIFGYNELKTNHQHLREIFLSSEYELASNSILITAENEKTKTDIYYYPSIQHLNTNTNVLIYSDSLSLDLYQVNPSFSPSGKYIAFIENSLVNDQSSKFPVMNLFLCETPKFDAENQKNIEIKKDYFFIDDSVITEERLEFSKGVVENYCWHPNKDVLFYVKEDVKEFSKIWYYDIKTRIKKPLDTGTFPNHSISISQDGKYIIFNTRTYQSNTNKHFSNCPTKTAEKNNDCCGLPSSIICVAELKIH